MSDISVNEKMQLIQQLRTQNYENNYAIHSWERNVCEEKTTSSFQLRFLLAVLLFAAFVFMDRNDIKVAGITMDKIEQVISADYEDKLELWVETMSR